MIDACEISALENTMQSNVPESEKDASLELKVVYGRFKWNPLHDSVPAPVRESYVRSTLNKWLAYVPPNEDEVVFLGFEDIEVNTSVALTSNCGHCPTPHPTDDFVFSALVGMPEGFTLNNNPSRARPVFLYYADCDLVSNIINREGLFALVSEEKRFRTAPTKDNWKERIDWKRAVNNAIKVK